MDYKSDTKANVDSDVIKIGVFESMTGANAALKIADIGYIMETGKITLSGSGKNHISYCFMVILVCFSNIIISCKILLINIVDEGEYMCL